MEKILGLFNHGRRLQGKVIAVPTTAALQKIADSLEVAVSALATAEGDQRAAKAILAEAAPAGFDHAAAGRAIAEARVSDLLNGGTTAEDVQQRMDRDRAASESAGSAFANLQTEARAQAERVAPMIAALRAQVDELDRAIRSELAKIGIKMEDDAKRALNDAIAAYSEALIHYRAVHWLQEAEHVGERGQQFIAPHERDLEISVPDALPDALPQGWSLCHDNYTVRFDRYDLAAVLADRRRALMENATNGVYPKAGARLHRADSQGDEA